MSDTPTALVVYRQSKGTDDSVSLGMQREQVPELVRELGAEIERELDLGVHTGFSAHTRDLDEPRIDANEKVQKVLQELEGGKYDIVGAWEERRLARDEFIHEWERRASLGEAEFVFIEENPEDEMTKGVKRVVEREAKKREIRQAKAAIQKRVEENGYWQGGEPFGLRLDEDGNYLVDDPDEFDTALEVIRKWEERDDPSKRGIADEEDITHHTVDRLADRRDLYRAVNEGAKIGYDYCVIWPDEQPDDD